MINSRVPQVLPAGTTHFCPAFGRYPNRAFKLKPCDEWSYWTGFDWQDMRCRPVPSVCREMIDVRPKVSGPSIAELIEQGYLTPHRSFKPSEQPAFPCPGTPVWNGPEDGLPSVGLEVEVLWSSITNTYVTGKILAHDGDRAVFRFTSGERKGEYQADGCFFSTGSDNLPAFRPIRTAEQLAAEESKRRVAEFAASIKLAGWTDPLMLASWLDAQGYRKVEQP